MRSPVTFSSELDVRVSAARLWPLVSDTDRINRAIGAPDISYETIPQEQGGCIRNADMKMGPLHIRWQEMPFEWVRNEGFSVQRVYEGGPIESMTLSCTITALDDEMTRVGVFGQFIPRNAAGAIAANLFGRKALNDLSDQVRHIESFAGGAASYPFKRAENHAPLNEEALLSAAVSIEHDLKQRILGKFLEYLKDAYDEDLIRMRPFALADRWGEDRMDVLKTFLAAAQAGILEMKWVPICPHCRGPKGETPTLRDLRAQGYCEACNISFALNFDDAVEVRFTIHPNIRVTTDATYCIGGPANTAHIIAQVRIPAGETRTVSVAVEPGRYRLRSPHVQGYARIEWVEGAGPQDAKLLANPDGFLPKELLFTGDRIELEVTNGTATEMLFAVEEESWEEKAASAAIVTTLQDFRDLFNREVLSPDSDLAIRSLTLMSCSLASASDLYDKAGDKLACVLIRKYFEFLTETIREHNGGIVKMRADTVMAVFSSARDAVRAGIEIERRIAEFNEGERLIIAIAIKLSLHRGPVIAVNFNDQLDYFGGTVDLAARLHAEAQGGEIVLSEALHEDPEIIELLREQKLSHELFDSAQKEIKVHRLMRVRVTT